VTPSADPVRIERIAAGGDGVGRLADGRTVFVPRTAPGDAVTLGELALHKRFARARLATLAEASPDRVDPPCPHYVRDDCGGCQLQHLAAPAQRAARRAIVGDALRRLARLDVPDPPLEPAVAEWHYRTRITLHPGGGGRTWGFHRLGRPGSIFELETCHIAAEPLVALWRALAPHRRLLPRTATSIALRLARDGVRHVVVRDAETRAWGGARELAAALARGGVRASVWWQPEGGAPRIMTATADGERPAAATAFEQVNPVMGDRLRHHAVDALGDVAGLRAWDLYAGLGQATALLAGRGATVESVELDRSAVEHAERHGPRDGVRRWAGRVEDAIRTLGAPDVVYTNPPRGGMDERVTAAIAGRPPRRIVYVSCDPATLARDLGRLGPGFRLAGVTAFDLFPQTAHVETVAVLERA
jgi:23S rRNA (uracil1939-C5)-methyltransferase